MSQSKYKLVRIKALLADLEIDRAITERQLERHYHLDILGPPVKSFVRTVFPSASIDTFQHCKIYTLSTKVTRMQSGMVLHLLGTAEMRHALGAGVEDWSSSAHRLGQTLIPDALWTTEHGEVAIEFDTGTYRYSLIDKKMRAFEKYAGVIWGTPSEQRAARIHKLYPHVKTLTLATLEHLGRDVPHDLEARRFGAYG